MTFEGLRPSGTLNQSEFETHDPVATWSDGGIAEEIVGEDFAKLQDSIAQALEAAKAAAAHEMKTYGAHQARDAVVDYTSNAFLDGMVIDGKFCLVLDCSNDAQQYKIFWPLDELIRAMRRSAEASGQEDALADALLSSISEQTQAPAPQTRTYRGGARQGPQTPFREPPAEQEVPYPPRYHNAGRRA